MGNLSRASNPRSIDAHLGGKPFLKLGARNEWFLSPLPRGSKVVPFWGSYVESYKVIPKGNYWSLWVTTLTTPGRSSQDGRALHCNVLGCGAVGRGGFRL